MADHLEIDTDEAFNTSRAVGNDAEELREELTRIAQDWDNLSKGWSGAAASAYTTLWQEWHEGAAALVDVLAESSQKLGRAAAAYLDRDGQSAESLASATIDLGL